MFQVLRDSASSKDVDKHRTYKEKLNKAVYNSLQELEQECKNLSMEDLEFFESHLFSEYMTLKAFSRLNNFFNERLNGFSKGKYLLKIIASHPEKIQEFFQKLNIFEEMTRCEDDEYFVELLLFVLNLVQYAEENPNLKVVINKSFIENLQEKIVYALGIISENSEQSEQLGDLYREIEGFLISDTSAIYPFVLPDFASSSFSSNGIRTIGLLSEIPALSQCLTIKNLSWIFEESKKDQSNTVLSKVVLEYIISSYTKIVKNSIKENCIMDDISVRKALVDMIFNLSRHVSNMRNEDLDFVIFMSEYFRDWDGKPLSYSLYFDWYRFQWELPLPFEIISDSIVFLLTSILQSSIYEESVRLDFLNISDETFLACFEKLKNDSEAYAVIHQTICEFLISFQQIKILKLVHWELLAKFALVDSSAKKVLREQGHKRIQEVVFCFDDPEFWQTIDENVIVELLQILDLLSRHEEEYCQERLQIIHDQYTLKKCYQNETIQPENSEKSIALVKKLYGKLQLPFAQHIVASYEAETIERHDEHVIEFNIFCDQIYDQEVNEELYEEASFRMAEVLMASHAVVSARGKLIYQREFAQRSITEMLPFTLWEIVPTNAEENESSNKKEKENVGEKVSDNGKKEGLRRAVQALEFVICNPLAEELKNQILLIINGEPFQHVEDTPFKPTAEAIVEIEKHYNQLFQYSEEMPKIRRNNINKVLQLTAQAKNEMEQVNGEGEFSNKPRINASFN